MRLVLYKKLHANNSHAKNLLSIGIFYARNIYFGLFPFTIICWTVVEKVRLFYNNTNTIFNNFFIRTPMLKILLEQDEEAQIGKKV